MNEFTKDKPQKETPLPFASPGADAYRNYVVMVEHAKTSGDYTFIRFLNNDMARLASIQRTLPPNSTTQFIRVIKDGQLQTMDVKSTALYILSVADKAKAARRHTEKIDEIIPAHVKHVSPRDYRYAQNPVVVLDMPHFTTCYTGSTAKDVSETIVGGVMADLLIDRSKEMGIVPYLVQENPAINNIIRKSAKSGELPEYTEYNMEMRATAVKDIAHRFPTGHVMGFSGHFDGVDSKIYGLFTLPSKNPQSIRLAKDMIEQTLKRGDANAINVFHHTIKNDGDSRGISITNPTGLQNYLGGIPFVLVENGNGPNPADQKKLLSIHSVATQANAIAGAFAEYTLQSKRKLLSTPVTSEVAAELKRNHGIAVHSDQLVVPPSVLRLHAMEIKKISAFLNGAGVAAPSYGLTPPSYNFLQPNAMKTPGIADLLKGNGAAAPSHGMYGTVTPSHGMAPSPYNFLQPNAMKPLSIDDLFKGTGVKAAPPENKHPDTTHHNIPKKPDHSRKQP